MNYYCILSSVSWYFVDIHLSLFVCRTFTVFLIFVSVSRSTKANIFTIWPLIKKSLIYMMSVITCKLHVSTVKWVIEVSYWCLPSIPEKKDWTFCILTKSLTHSSITPHFSLTGACIPEQGVSSPQEIWPRGRTSVLAVWGFLVSLFIPVTSVDYPLCISSLHFCQSLPDVICITEKKDG